MVVIVDSHFMIRLLRGDPRAAAKSRELIARRETVVIPTPVVFEIEEGFVRIGATRRLKQWQTILTRTPVADLNEARARRAATIQATLKSRGLTAGDVDVLISGFAETAQDSIVSEDSDFPRIQQAAGFRLEDYSVQRAQPP